MNDYLYTYSENETSERPRVEFTREWFTPDVKHIIKRLNNEWEINNIPLTVEIKNERVSISHKFPNSIGEIAQIRLYPKLAYILGYTETEYTVVGQVLRFDSQVEYVAPHPAKTYLKHENLSYIDMMTSDLTENLNKKIQDGFNRQAVTIRDVVEDSIHRYEKGIIPISQFSEKKDQESWIIKGRVVRGERQQLQNDGTIFIMTLRDHTGEMKITGFGKNGDILNELATIGTNYTCQRVHSWEEISNRYYVNTNFQNMPITSDNVTITIKDDAYQVKIKKV